MAAIIVTSTAQADLDRIIVGHSLPASVRERVRHAISPLGDFPLLGATLRGRWAAFRFILGPWRWMIIVYHFDLQADLVTIVAIEDARFASSVTGSEEGRQP